MKFSRDSVRTGGVGDPETTDLDRRAQDVVKFGTVKEVDYKRSPPAYRVAIGDESDEDNYILTDWLPAGGGRAKGDTETHFLEVGEKVVLLSEGGELSTAQVLPGGTFTAENDDEKAGADKAGIWRKKFKNGAEISYDRNTGDMILDSKDHGKITMTSAGITASRGNLSYTLTSQKLVIDAPVEFKRGFTMGGTSRAATIQGDVRVDGNIWATQSIQAGGAILGNPSGNGGTVPPT